MSAGIYAKLSDGSFVLLEERQYEREDDLQALIENHPALLGGEQISPEEPRRWLLVNREQGVADSESSGSRWRLDHLFIDQDAMPTLVEVKRKEDTRIRREVIGQMLEYASHAAVYWRADNLRQRFEDACIAAGEDPDHRIAELTGSAKMESDAFWELVGNRLEAGRIRVIFAADRLPPEVKRIIEFLNHQMSPAEVLGVEIHHYTNGDIRTFVPRVIGASETASQKKTTATKSSRAWDEELFFDDLSARTDSPHVEAVRRLYGFVQDSQFSIRWGTGTTDGSVIVKSILNRVQTVFSFYSDGSLWIYFAGIQGSQSLDAIRDGLREYFKQKVGVDLGAGTEYARAASGWWKGIEQIIAKLQEIEAEMLRVA